jgi:2-hydroxychromene-2-carboxylate isomerase
MIEGIPVVGARGAVLCFDVISPYAYLFHELVLRQPLDVAVDYRPVLFAGLLNAHGNKGPAEIERKRLFTYRFCTWYGAAHGIPFTMPATHPFNPIRFLRLILALGCEPAVITEVFRMLYSEGADPDAEETWQTLCSRLNVADATALIEKPSVKSQLRENTERAAQSGVFGVPTVIVGEELFWGVDALPMLRAYLADPTLFASAAMQRAASAQIGARRKSV